jgi:hypothetical protein
MRIAARPARAVSARIASTRAVGTNLANLKDEIDRYLSLPELLHFLGVLCLHKALTIEVAHEGDDEDDYGLDFEDNQTGLETALLVYPSEVSTSVKHCLEILIQRDDPDLEDKVMARLWSRIQQFAR